MLRHARYISIHVFFATCIAVSAQAQIQLNNMPTWTSNQRFLAPGITEIKHPSLSLNGFDNGGSDAHGYGLKQILENVFGNSPQESINDVFDGIKLLAANNAYVNPPNTRSEVNQNVNRLQARAFVALATYVLEKHGYFGLGLPSHATAAQRLKDALLATDAWAIDAYPDEGDDPVKWTPLLTGMARTLDLYLALENAYCFYGTQGDANGAAECDGTFVVNLLTESEKNAVYAHYRIQMNGVQDLDIVDVLGLPTPVRRSDFEVGNYSLKYKVALGYAAMAYQGSYDVTDLLRAGFEATLLPAGGDRHRNLGYQTDFKSFFAEGPYYFQFALSDLIPFWHAVRINDILDYYPGFVSPDPFTSGYFTPALEWLADVVTPEGATPPLDDGNRKTMENASLMRWTVAYGEESIGKKFAWIADRYTSPAQFATNDQVLLVELAIPRLELGTGQVPHAEIGTIYSGQPGESGDQQLIIRRETMPLACDHIDNAGECHYVLLNGESGRAYYGGEGHEQPDQLQLLYYIDGLSVIMDSGYDRGGGALNNSSWASYYEHNTMGSVEGEGGLGAPVLDVALPGKSIDAVNVGDLYRTMSGKVDVLHGIQYLPNLVTLANGQQAGGYYHRDVLFIGGDKPYLIDFNRGYHNVNNLILDRTFRVSYHSNSEYLFANGYSEPGSDDFINWTHIGGANKWLYVHPVSIEYPVKFSLDDVAIEDDTAEEFFRTPVNIKRLDIKNYNNVGITRNHFSVATLLVARDGIISEKPASPKLIWPGYQQDTHQGWVQKQDANTYDVFVARSINQNHTPQTLLVNPADVDPSYPDYVLALTGDKPYGFVRLIYNGTQWTMDPDYRLNFTLPTFQAIIQGLNVVEAGAYHTWTAYKVGGAAPFTYQWDAAYGCNPGASPSAVQCDTWVNLGTGATMFQAFDTPVALNLIVTDANGFVATSRISVHVEGVSADPPNFRLADLAFDDWSIIGVPQSYSSVPVGKGFFVPDPQSLILYDYQGGYVPITGLEPGQGAFSFYPETYVHTGSGLPVESVTLSVQEGWNFVSGPSCTVPLDQVNDPAGIIIQNSFFSYFGGPPYTSATAFTPGLGYWLRVSAPGTLFVSCSAAAASKTQPSVVARLSAMPVSSFAQLRIADAQQHVQTLYLGGTEKVRGALRNRYHIPPAFKRPAGLKVDIPVPFDVRFTGDSLLTEKRVAKVEVQASAFPLTVHASHLQGGQLHVRPRMQHGKLGAWVTLGEGEDVIFTDHDLAALDVRLGRNTPVKGRVSAGPNTLAQRAAVVPEVFTLAKAYPNPFQEQTTLRIGLPEAAAVTVGLYDLTGRLVETVVAESLTAGWYRYTLEGAALPSGVYLVAAQYVSPDGGVQRLSQKIVVTR